MRLWRRARWLLAIAVALFGAGLWFWKATTVLRSETRFAGPVKRSFTIRVLRYRPISQFEFRSETSGRILHDRYTFAAFETQWVRSVEWIEGRDAVRLALDVQIDGGEIVEDRSIVYDFERACLVWPFGGNQAGCYR